MATPTLPAPAGAAVPAAGGAGVVERLLHDVDRLPGRQPVLLRVARLVDDPDTSSADLADVCAGGEQRAGVAAYGGRVRASPSLSLTGPEGAPVVVLVHGAPDRSGTFRPLLEHLGDLRVATYDRRGYGRSVDLAPPTSMRDHAEDLLALLDGLPRPRTVVAHSFGSAPTLLAAVLRPEAFDALGVWEPPMVWLDWWPQASKDFNARVAASADPGEEVEAFFRQALGAAYDALPEEVRARRRREGVAFARDMASSHVEPPFLPEQVSVPVLVGHGTQTSPEHQDCTPWLLERLPRARSWVLEGAGHFAHRTHPEQFAVFVREALAR